MISDEISLPGAMTFELNFEWSNESSLMNVSDKSLLDADHNIESSNIFPHRKTARVRADLSRMSTGMVMGNESGVLVRQRS